MAQFLEFTGMYPAGKKVTINIENINYFKPITGGTSIMLNHGDVSVLNSYESVKNILMPPVPESIKKLEKGLNDWFGFSNDEDKEQGDKDKELL